jgi:uncharacterized protein YbjQ (UPF0145 family)
MHSRAQVATGHISAGAVRQVEDLGPGGPLDCFANIRDIVGGRSAAYEKELRRAKAVAVEEMSAQAKELGANAVIGVDLDYETIGQSMLMVVASGTAVVIDERRR